MHTTASDGRLTPAELVARAHDAGLTTISVTDHDTVAAIADASTAAAPLGMRVVSGIEITSVDDGRDVHMLGYFFNAASERLAAMLVKQRVVREQRVREIIARLAALNMVIDAGQLLLLASTRPGSSIGRPQVAREMVNAGYVSSVHEAFDLWLSPGRPAFVPRTGPTPADVIDAIHEAGGIASLAHPGVTKRDELIAPLVEHGLDAIEVRHSDHTPEAEATYRQLAARLAILVSGGSDFHGDQAANTNRPQRNILGAVTLSAADFAALESASRIRQSAGGPAGEIEAGR